MSLATAMEAEAVCLKTEPGEACVKTEPGEVCVKTEPGEACVKTEPGEVCVKTEPGEACAEEEREREDSARGVSAAAARAGLYTGHEVKDELVLGPEEWHRPQVLPLPVCSDGGRAREQLAMTCSVVLERLRGDATAHSRDKPYVCEHCDKHFINTSALKKHMQCTHLSLGLKKFACDVCSSMFETNLLLVEHEKSEHGVTNFICAECEYRTCSKKDLELI
ncbi:zinc finger protein 343-like isoform X2 [Leguminivora glycinivorella]|uniref:zinc finger protein 343-like isoform X2 n=1 Tax=Leguminivora glycinivorella TaxID=1035111 RepID=UPI00200FD660|nr:zinc finger protein 343-like isoform X2 [Leguminivora glycinivorella]